MNGKSTRAITANERAFLTRLGEVVTMKREVLSLDLRAAAIAVNVSPSTLSRIENGKWPDVLSLLRIFRWLGPQLSERAWREVNGVSPERRRAAKPA